VSELLAVTVDKFVLRVASDRRYTRDGVWAMVRPHGGAPSLPDGARVRVGVSDYVQRRGGDLTFATVQPVGTELAIGATLSELETIKINLAVPSPVGGTIVAVNPALAAMPELVNQDPYGAGWLVEIEVRQWPADHGALLDAAAYLELMRGQAQQELAP
jgi:glycine cleavage system H protein